MYRVADDLQLTLRDLWGSVGGLNQDIASLWSKSGCDGLCEGLNTVEERCASINTELELLESAR